MTAEITNLEEFKDKFASLMAAQTALIASGIEPSPSLSSKIIDEFVQQFMIATPMPAQRASAGFVVTVLPTKQIPFDFKGDVFTTEHLAQEAVIRFNNERGYGTVNDYEIKEIFYFV